MLPISVEPRAHAKRISLHPPLLNSLEVVRVPPKSWRTSTGEAAERPARAAINTDLVYIFGCFGKNGVVLGVVIKVFVKIEL